MKTTFCNERVAIRPFHHEDIPLLLEAVLESIHELSAWLPWCHPAYSIHDTEKFIRSRQDAWDKAEEYSFAIMDLETDCFLGGVGLNRINREDLTGNIGYWVRTSETRQGIASTAVKLIAQFGFCEARLNRLEILAAADNAGSVRAAEKSGAKREGTLRRRLLLSGRAHDAAVFSLVPDDMKA